MDFRHVLKRLGFVLTKPNVRAEEYRNRAGYTLYVTNADEAFGVVLSPAFEGKIRSAAAGAGVPADADYYHNSNMPRFPRRKHGGVEQIHYGVKIDFTTASQLTSVLEVLA